MVLQHRRLPVRCSLNVECGESPLLDPSNSPLAINRPLLISPLYSTLSNLTPFQTQSDIWANRTTSLLNALGYFYYQDTMIMTEAGCEPIANCNTDQRSFKAFLTRWLAATAAVAPWTAPQIISLLRPSAAAAAQSCAGGASGTMCGMRW